MAEGKWRSICRVVKRKRTSESVQLVSSSLRRCLNYWDVTALGVGSSLGIGVYVLIGAVAFKLAGPSVLLSFLIAAVISLLAGLCYAEFGARAPLAGSAYIYTYMTVGELVAFVVGWNNILEYVFGTASVARGLSEYIDVLANHTMSNWFLESMPMAVPLLSAYFDLFSFCLVIVVGVLLAVGVRESSTVNNAFSLLNLAIIILVIILGAIKTNTGNWSIPVEDVPAGHGAGGFFPYGMWGTLQGAAVCFYGFVGFDVVNASGEEVKDPRANIPAAIMSVLVVVFVMYASVSTVITMMVPYYHLTTIASVGNAFTYVGWGWMWWIVTVGAFVGITTSLFGALFPLPRLLYSMASDGLFIHWFAKVSRNKKSPIIATAIPTIIIATLSGLLELEQLVLMMCIGTLGSYTIVAICVVLIRHRSKYVPDVKASFMKQIIGRGDKMPTSRSKLIINIAMALYICLCISIALVHMHTGRPLVAVVILHVCALLTIAVMMLQPTAGDHDLTFKTPLVPLLPCASIYANIHLMVIINWHTWIRVLIWIIIGIPIYFICVFLYTQNAGRRKHEEEVIPHVNKNGKQTPVQIVVESPTPPSSSRYNNYGDHNDDIKTISAYVPLEPVAMRKNEQIVVQQMQIENNEEKEAKIIDLLDQVLQAEEDSYSEIISLKESKDESANELENEEDGEAAGIPHRKSLSELSDAGSGVSAGNQVLSKYDVIAQVHREDLPKVNEEEERSNHLENVTNDDDVPNDEDEDITAFNESDAHSQTDESGYSDTIDRPALSTSMEDTSAPNIPVPPPFDENYFKVVPITTNFRKYNTISSRHSKPDLQADDDVNEPRVSVQSNNSQHSQGDGNIRFGSSRQIKFMSKLNDIFQKTMNNEEEEPRRRSQSTGNVAETELVVAENRERPQLFLDLKKELLARDSLPNLRPVNKEEEVQEPIEPEQQEEPEDDDDEDKSMSREDLKSKLENIFAVGGPQLLAKPRLMKSNPPTPEESYQNDQSSTESIPKLPKVEKNDTLKRQKEKFGQVLNSIRLSLKDDVV